jgi:hypothetical protein
MSSEAVNKLVVNGKEYPFRFNGHHSCNGCKHDLRTGDSKCAIIDDIRSAGMECCMRQDFFQPREAEKPLAEQVKGWMEAGKYVVDTRPNWNGCCRVWHGLKRIMFADGEDANITFSNNQIKDDSTILHHGDAVSTIKWLCEQGYDVEFDWCNINGSIEKRIATPAKYPCSDYYAVKFAGEHDILAGGLNNQYSGSTITRFYRPTTAETDAQKIERLLREGFTVEYRVGGGNLVTANFHSGDIVTTYSPAHDYKRLDIPISSSRLAFNNNDATYLAHYREPSVEDVLRKMDELTVDNLCQWFEIQFGFPVPQDYWNRLSDYYAMARWQLIESNPENNVSL